jgi:hypothetical protein
MQSWEPSRLNAARDRDELASRAERGVAVLVERLAPARLGEVTAALADLDGRRFRGGSGLLHPYFFHWYFSLINLVRTQAFGSLTSHLDGLEHLGRAVAASRRRALGNVERIGVAIDLDYEDEYTTNLTGRAQEMATTVGGTDNTIRLVRDLEPELVATLRGAFATLDEKWPEASEEIQDFVQQLLFFESPRAIGYADFNVQGSIFLRTQNVHTGRKYTPEELSAEILHESSHVRLCAMISAQPLFMNDGAPVYRSPLRPDPRPMMGVFHQMFVLSRLRYFYNTLDRGTGRYDKELASVYEDLDQARDIVNGHALLTTAGQELMDAINQQCAQV